MANFKKKPLPADRIALVESAAAQAPLVREPGTNVPQALGTLDGALSALPESAGKVGASQDQIVKYRVGAVYEIPLGEIKSNPFNPRAVYTASAIEDMANSMLAGGQRVSATAFVNAQGEVILIEGETRLRGARAGGLPFLRVEIRPRPASDRELYEEARAANVERRDQSPLDDAIKWKELLAKKIYPTQAALAQALSLGEDHVSRTLSLANLPTRIIHAAAEHPELLSHKMLNALREYWAVRGDDDTLELILDVAKNGMGYRDVAARRKAAENGPVKRTRSNRELVKFKGAAGELKTFVEEGRVELVLKGLTPEASKIVSLKILAMFAES
jgi:ParB family chromosome partitioning protein